MIEAKFWARTRPASNGCLIWTGGWSAKKKGGVRYPRIRVAGKAYRGHRFAYELKKGPIPAGGVIRHTCDNSMCVNPDHLITGTTAQNNRDAAERNRMAHGARHYRAKLTEAAVRDIRKRRVLGESGHALAREYGITFRTLYSAANGETWRHVPMP
jgi:hypothetical protein